VRQAKVTAQRLVDEADDAARRMRHEAEDYCDQKLAGMEIVLDRLTRTVHSGRAKLASPPPPAPVEHESARAKAGTEEDGFFDQDVS
jgi:cell division septum initiation protein DivIVA